VSQLAVPLSTLIVRVDGDPLAFASVVRQVIVSVDADQPLSAMRTMDEVVNETVADRREQTLLLSTFGGLALFLSSLGLYGVLAYAVSQRSREIGLRMALGATTQQVLLQVVGQGLVLIALGLGIGAVAAWGLTRTMKTMLYGVPATDPQTFATVVGLLGAVALTACLVPAMRASKVDPMIVLRNE
jgi:putative ABC transport system permease protein